MLSEPATSGAPLSMVTEGPDGPEESPTTTSVDGVGAGVGDGTGGDGDGPGPPACGEDDPPHPPRATAMRMGTRHQAAKSRPPRVKLRLS